MISFSGEKRICVMFDYFYKIACNYPLGFGAGRYPDFIIKCRHCGIGVRDLCQKPPAAYSMCRNL